MRGETQRWKMKAVGTGEGSRQGRRRAGTQLFGRTQAPFGEECLWNTLHPPHPPPPRSEDWEMCKPGGSPLLSDPAWRARTLPAPPPVPPGPPGGVSRTKPSQEAQWPQSEPASPPSQNSSWPECTCVCLAAHIWGCLWISMLYRNTHVSMHMYVHTCTFLPSGNTG